MVQGTSLGTDSVTTHNLYMGDKAVRDLIQILLTVISGLVQVIAMQPYYNNTVNNTIFLKYMFTL